MTKSKQNVLLIGRWIIAIGLLVLVINKIDSAVLWKSLQRFDPVFGAIIIVLNIALLFLLALRWKLIAEKLDINAGYLPYIRAVWIGALSAQFGPPLIFSEVARFKALQQYAQNKQLIISQIVDRLSGQIVLLFLLILLLPISLPLIADAFPNQWLVRSAVFIIALGAVIIAIFSYRQQLNIMKYRQVINLLNPIVSISHFGISLLIQLLLMSCFILAAMGLGRLQHPILMLSLLPVVLTSLVLLPITVSDWGTREASAVFFLSFSGLAVENIVAASLIYGAAYTLTALLGLFYLFTSDINYS